MASTASKENDALHDFGAQRPSLEERTPFTGELTVSSGARGVLNKVLYREAPPRGQTLTLLYTIFDRKGSSPRIAHYMVLPSPHRPARLGVCLGGNFETRSHIARYYGLLLFTPEIRNKLL